MALNGSRGSNEYTPEVENASTNNRAKAESSVDVIPSVIPPGVKDDPSLQQLLEYWPSLSTAGQDRLLQYAAALKATQRES